MYQIRWKANVDMRSAYNKFFLVFLLTLISSCASERSIFKVMFYKFPKCIYYLLNIYKTPLKSQGKEISAVFCSNSFLKINHASIQHDQCCRYVQPYGIDILLATSVVSKKKNDVEKFGLSDYHQLHF